MAYVVMVYIVMAHVVMVYIVMAYVVMVYIVTAKVPAMIGAHLHIVMAYIVMAQVPAMIGAHQKVRAVEHFGPCQQRGHVVDHVVDGQQHLEPLHEPT